MIKEKLKLSQQDYEKIEQELKNSGLQEKQIDMILNDEYKTFNEGT